MARVISGIINGPLILSLTDPLAAGGSDDPLIITSTGTITSTGSDGIDGSAGTAWTIFNDGVVSVTSGWDISLAGAGFLYNSGLIESGLGVEIGGYGFVVNQGEIDSVTIAGGGDLINDGAIGPGLTGVGVTISGGTGNIINNGSIQGYGRGVQLSDGGTVTNGIGASISGFGAVAIDVSGTGMVVNQGVVTSGGSEEAIDITDGVLANQGYIFGYAKGVVLGDGSVTNRGDIIGSQQFGVVLTDGGSVTNFANISGALRGVSSDGGFVSITNEGLIEGSGSYGPPGVGISLNQGSVANVGTIFGQAAGVLLGRGVVVNQGSILGGVEITAGSGTVINGGLISHGSANPGIDVLFDPTTTDNLLVIQPGAVFDGAADATSGTHSTIELAHGAGATNGIGEGQFNGFDTLKADSGANWTLNGANTIGTVLNDGSLGIAGSLDVTTAVDPDSMGLFRLDGASILEIAAALGTNSKMSFATGSSLLIDQFGLFGERIGTGGYAGPLLESFGGSSVDLKTFSVAGLHSDFSASSGLLQLTNSASQLATLKFQTSSLGTGMFHFGSDGHGGVLITHS